MKRVGWMVALITGLGSCNVNADKMADDYCTCMQDFEKGKSGIERCREMAEDHALSLQDNEEALKKYMVHVSECLMYDDIRTNEDLRQDRREKRKKK